MRNGMITIQDSATQIRLSRRSLPIIAKRNWRMFRPVGVDFIFYEKRLRIRRGMRVRLIDMDPQASLTQAFGGQDRHMPGTRSAK